MLTTWQEADGVGPLQEVEVCSQVDRRREGMIGTQATRCACDFVVGCQGLRGMTSGVRHEHSTQRSTAQQTRSGWASLLCVKQHIPARAQFLLNTMHDLLVSLAWTSWHTHAHHYDA